MEQIKMMQSFIGLADLIFKINGKTWQFIIFFFAIKTTHRCSHVVYEMLMHRAAMIFLPSRLRFVEKAYETASSADRLNLYFVLLSADFWSWWRKPLNNKLSAWATFHSRLCTRGGGVL